MLHSGLILQEQHSWATTPFPHLIFNFKLRLEFKREYGYGKVHIFNINLEVGEKLSDSESRVVDPVLPEPENPGFLGYFQNPKPGFFSSKTRFF